MTDFSKTFLGKALVSLFGVFGMAAPAAEAKVDAEAAIIKTDVEAAFRPVVSKIEALGAALLGSIITNGVQAVHAAPANASVKDVFDTVIQSVEATVGAGVKDGAAAIGPETVAALASLVMAHVQVAAADAKTGG